MSIYAAVAAVFLVVDGAWLVLVAGPMFQREVGALLRSDPDLSAAAVFYVIYPIALTALAVLPSRTAMAAGLRGALLGLAAYGTFDLTNLAILKGWTVKVAAFDMAWGTFVSGLTAALGVQFARWRGIETG